MCSMVTVSFSNTATRNLPINMISLQCCGLRWLFSLPCGCVRNLRGMSHRRAIPYECAVSRTCSQPLLQALASYLLRTWARVAMAVRVQVRSEIRCWMPCVQTLLDALHTLVSRRLFIAVCHNCVAYPSQQGSFTASCRAMDSL